jgi:hypothetical protein
MRILLHTHKRYAAPSGLTRPLLSCRAPGGSQGAPAPPQILKGVGLLKGGEKQGGLIKGVWARLLGGVLTHPTAVGQLLSNAGHTQNPFSPKDKLYLAAPRQARGFIFYRRSLSSFPRRRIHALGTPLKPTRTPGRAGGGAAPV